MRLLLIVALIGCANPDDSDVYGTDTETETATETDTETEAKGLSVALDVDTAQVMLLNEVEYAARVENSTFVFPPSVAPGPYDLVVSPSHETHFTMSVPVVLDGAPRHLDIQVVELPEDPVMLPAEPNWVHVGGGFHLRTYAGEIVAFVPQPLAAVRVPPADLPLDEVNTTPVAMFHLAPYEARSAQPLDFRIDNTWSGAEGQELTLWQGGSYVGDGWRKVADVQVIDGVVAGTGLSIMSTVLLTER